MAGTLVFRAFSAIHNESLRLHRQALAIECRKDRRKRLRKLKLHPSVRLCRVISAAAGLDCAGIPRNLSADERALKYALESCPALRLELRDFERRVLSRARDEARFDRCWRRFGNHGNQHPEAYPYPDTAQEVQRELSFRESDEYLEMGKTYSWYMHRWDERPSFADATAHGECEKCRVDLPVWRSCGHCAYAHFVEECEDVYVMCMECWSPEHQADLKEVTRCEGCGGPSEIVVGRPERRENDTGPWMGDEDWD